MHAQHEVDAAITAATASAIAAKGTKRMRNRPCYGSVVGGILQ